MRAAGLKTSVLFLFGIFLFAKSTASYGPAPCRSMCPDCFGDSYSTTSTRLYARTLRFARLYSARARQSVHHAASCFLWKQQAPPPPFPLGPSISHISGAVPPYGYGPELFLAASVCAGQHGHAPYTATAWIVTPFHKALPAWSADATRGQPRPCPRAPRT
eukprot:scaffold2480_cov122-Isochrysis_galbana.AAC.5